MSENIQCPYCEEYVEIEPYDEHYENYEEYECPKCRKNFEMFAETTINYSVVGRADCLNGSKHKWKQQVGTPEIYFRGKYICEDCSATRRVEEERASKEEWNKYFNRDWSAL